MIRFLHKISNTQIIGNAKLAIIFLLFACALIYAFCAIRGLVYNNEYSRTLSFHSLKLDKSKEYVFVKEFKITASPNTINIPMGRVNMPDSLCTLYYDREWRLKLTDNLRKSHKDTTKETIFFPFCRLNEKKNDYSDADFFHNSAETPTQNDLLTGIRFNNASGRDAFVIELIQQGDEFYYLTKGVAFFANRNVPISNKKQNTIELDFCMNGDTVGISKYVFSFPFLGSQNQPERKNIIIENDKINYNEEFQPIGNEDFTFSINDCVFRLKSNYSTTAKYFVLPLLFLIIAGFSLLMLCRLYALTNRMPNPKQRNLIKIEQFNILSLRVLFNCIILLGFPILLLKIQEKESRLWLISILAIILNINWLNLIKWLAKRIKSDKKSFSIISLIIVVATMLATFFTSNELVFGKIPVLKVTTLIFIFLPFAVNCLPKLPKISLFDNIKKRILKDEEHANKNAKDKSEQEFSFNLTCYSILIILVLAIALILSKDFATLIFTLLSLLLILLINFKRFWNFIITASGKELCYTALFLVIVLGSVAIYLSHNIDEKKYRFQSSWFFPDNEERFSEFPNIESSRETIAGQIFLLNAVENDFKPNFNTVVLPEYKSVFFSDYAVLWSFKTGDWLWFSLYFSTLLMLSYTIISLLIIFSKQIKLKTEKRSFYNKKIIFGLNLLLAVLFVQYIYTFLTNFWTLPLTGQSPGLISPVYWEYIFHIILINYLYVYLATSVDDRQFAIRQDNDKNSKTSSYIPTKFKSLVIPMIVCAGSIVFLFFQRNRICNHIQENGYTMYWKIAQDSVLNSYSNFSKDSLLVLAHESFDKMDDDANEKRKFRSYLYAYYQSDNAKRRHYIDTDYIQSNTNMDSIAKIKELDTRGYYKFMNGSPVIFINNKYYGGCPPNAETVDFELQEKFNKALEDWATKIDEKQGFKMVGGSIIVAENESGYIHASASYPLMYNENLYHILYENNRMNDVLQNYKVGTISEQVKIRYDNSDYLNFADNAILPGSIVKPLLAYGGLSFLPNNYSQSWLNDFLGWSRNEKAEKMFTDLFTAGGYFDAAKSIYETDFDFTPYTRNQSELKEAKSLTHAVGQYQKLVFKKTVQAYMRIKTGKKVELLYEKKDKDFELLSLENEQLNRLRTAMCALRNGTAKKVGNSLQNNGINIDYFLAKTGTAQISKDTKYNRTSAIIIVGDNITVGIQLYGVVPKNDDGLSAQYLCNELIKNKIINF
ncbi:MAG: hypothetical protein LBS55_07445 [Prevotellaceae bacterium]|jgi:hypothetical protein|nr:hypothetical protein [Prevotellaceae bacterium]